MAPPGERQYLCGKDESAPPAALWAVDPARHPALPKRNGPFLAEPLDRRERLAPTMASAFTKLRGGQSWHTRRPAAPPRRIASPFPPCRRTVTEEVRPWSNRPCGRPPRPTSPSRQACRTRPAPGRRGPSPGRDRVPEAHRRDGGPAPRCTAGHQGPPGGPATALRRSWPADAASRGRSRPFAEHHPPRPLGGGGARVTALCPSIHTPVSPAPYQALTAPPPYVPNFERWPVRRTTSLAVPDGTARATSRNRVQSPGRPYKGVETC
jgi:hypothetical protein